VAKNAEEMTGFRNKGLVGSASHSQTESQLQIADPFGFGVSFSKYDKNVRCLKKGFSMSILATAVYK
jgi:hypothetical protein